MMAIGYLLFCSVLFCLVYKYIYIYIYIYLLCVLFLVSIWYILLLLLFIWWCLPTIKIFFLLPQNCLRQVLYFIQNWHPLILFCVCQKNASCNIDWFVLTQKHHRKHEVISRSIWWHKKHHQKHTPDK